MGLPPPWMVARQVRSFPSRSVLLDSTASTDAIPPLPSRSHPEYVTSGGHVECANDLKAYLASHQGKMRMGKRSVAVAPSHKDLAQRLAKKAGQPSYYIIAVDHIHVSLLGRGFPLA